jgi:hypothetical protein
MGLDRASAQGETDVAERAIALGSIGLGPIALGVNTSAHDESIEALVSAGFAVAR